MKHIIAFAAAVLVTVVIGIGNGSLSAQQDRSIADRARALISYIGDTLEPRCTEQREQVQEVLRRLDEIAKDPVASETHETVSRRRAQLVAEIRDLEAVRESIKRANDVERQVAASLKENNVADLQAAIERGNWLAVDDVYNTLTKYFNDPRNHFNAGRVDMWVTPFGYFIYEPVVAMSSGSRETALTFRPIDLFDFGTIPKILGDAMRASLQLHMKAAYREKTSALKTQSTASSPNDDDKVITAFKDYVWQWKVTSPPRLRYAEYTGEFAVTPAQTGSANTGAIRIENAIQVNGWFTKIYNVVTDIDTFLGAFVGMTLPEAVRAYRRWRRRRLASR